VRKGCILIGSRDVVDGMGFETMTKVQAGTIPQAMKHKDCVVEVSYLAYRFKTSSADE
jgi:hypothetical protein